MLMLLAKHLSPLTNVCNSRALQGLCYMMDKLAVMVAVEEEEEEGVLTVTLL
jgi:hypothetical protein